MTTLRVRRKGARNECATDHDDELLGRSAPAGARTAAQGLNINVVLIDGVELARLMVGNNLGVSDKQVYEVKALGNDYFADE